MYSGKRLFWHNCPQLLFVYKTVSQISFVDEIREKYLDGVREKNTLQLLVNKANTLNHSHKETDSLETWAVLIEIYKLCWNLPSSPKHRGSIKKTWLPLKGISSLQVTFVLIWMKQTLIWFNLQRDGTCLTPRILLQKVCSYKYQFCTKVCASSRLVSQEVHMMAGQNIKKKYLMCQIPIKMLKQEATPNSSLHNLKIYSSKRCRKTSQSWINSIAC